MEGERVLITGAGGMLGNAVFPYFSGRYASVCATDMNLSEPWLRQLDVRDAQQLGTWFAEIKPTLVLHLAACTDLEFCEVHADVARDTNDVATKAVAQLCEEYGATLVYISTAGVFDGTKDGFYTEQDQPNPIMVYGQTKYDGELNVARYCSRHFIVRAGWMVGGGVGKDHKFVHHILGQIVAGVDTIHAVNDRFGTPTYTHDFALNLFKLLESRKYGTYHMVCEGSGTRYDVARHILDITGQKNIALKSVDSSFFESNYFAPRPVSEMMRNANLAALGINRMRPWREALQDYVTREFPLAMAGAAKGVERRQNSGRRKMLVSWNATARRKSAGRRADDDANSAV